MSNQITCPHCKQQFEPSEAFKHQLEETVLKEAAVQHKAELARLAREKEELLAQQAKKMQEVEKRAQDKAQAAAQDSVSKLLKDQEDQILQLKKRADQAEEQELKIRREKRELEESKRRFELEKQRQLDEERAKIRELVLKEAEEKQELKSKEKDMIIQNLQKSLADAQRKAQQGSQQSQGEVLELELEALLRREFPMDIITEVKKGQRGADVVQEVVDKNGSHCGVILWELKNAQWSQAWVSKLKDNQRAAKAQIAVLVATETPEGLDTFKYQDGVWIATRKMAVPLALALRYDLVRVNFEKLANTNKSQKAEVLYQYITSTEFKHRVEAIVEAFSDMRETIEKEKTWFRHKWNKQEMQIRQVVDNTIGMRADLEGLIGNALPSVDYLALPEDEPDS